MIGKPYLDWISTPYTSRDSYSATDMSSKGNKFYTKKKKVVQKDSESDADSVDSASSHSDSEGEDEEEDEVGAKDGMADMMSKILNQKTTKDVPVLEKRKTTIMKSIDAERGERSELKKAQAAKSLIRTRQLSQPGHSNPEKERSLRKLATKGVVALFNAVAEAQRVARDLDDDNMGGSSYTKKEEKKVAMAKVDIKKMSKSNFLDLLTGGESGKKGVGSASAADEDAGDHSSDDGLDPANSRGKWGALRDDYIQEDEGVLRNWNKADDVRVLSADHSSKTRESSGGTSTAGKRSISTAVPAVKGAHKVSMKKRKHDANSSR